MMIPRRLLVDPFANRTYATFAVALSMVVFAYSTLFGPLSILLYYAVWLPLVIVDPSRILASARDFVLPLMLVALALVSTSWSDAPATTLRSSLQYASHILCALVAARVVDTKSLSRGIVLGCLLVILYSLAFGESAYDPMDGSYTFVGAFGSKNQLGFFASLGMYFGIVLVFVVREAWPLKLAALAATVIMAVALDASRSATSILALAIALSTFLSLLLSLHFSPQTRGALLALLVPFFGLGLAAFVELGAVESVLGLFGKDTTLTGRTYLWTQGMETAWSRPLLGVGYQAYWIQGRSGAERLWAEFYIGARSGFHFHSTVVETIVELGFVGLAVVGAIFIRIPLLLCARVLRFGDREAVTLLGLFILMMIRSFAEVDMLFPFTIGSFLTFLLSFSARREARAPARLRPLGAIVPPRPWMETWTRPRALPIARTGKIKPS